MGRIGQIGSKRKKMKKSQLTRHVNTRSTIKGFGGSYTSCFRTELELLCE